ncbi:MAG TPA: HAD family hydrolase [Candidatus Baltobacteraceae bacterium]|nr:HAD family hydrolase [Candidatus Baltobacteraceae bacterium]
MSDSALIFDLDGTLVDSVFEHVTAWHLAFLNAGIDVPAFELHKRIGMTGELLIDAIAEAHGIAISPTSREAISAAHAERYRKVIHRVPALPGAKMLWSVLRARGVPWAIATSAEQRDADVLLQTLELPEHAVVVTQGASRESKPSPRPFEAAAKKLHVQLTDAMIVGDSVWDILASRRAGAFGVGVLTGGYGREELVAAGAYRVFNDVGELARRLDELGL